MRLLPALRVLAVLALLPACGDPAGGEHAGWRAYSPPSAAYRVRYLAPPWKLKETDGDAAYLTIRSTAASVSDDPDALLVLPKYELDVEVRSRTADAVLRAERTAATGRREVVVDGPRPVVTDAGDEGVELLTFQDAVLPQRYHRYVAFDAPRGSIFLHFEANPDLDDPEIDDMIGAFEVAPDAP